MKKLFCILLLYIYGVAAYSQNLNTQKLDSFFSALDGNKKVMGSFAISKNGKILYKNAIGFIDENKATTANTSTKYRIGSISKMFTAAIIFQLVEENKLNVGTTLNEYFPQIQNASKITVGNLLNHRSGIFNITNDTNYLSWCASEISQKEMLAKIAAYPSQFEPDSKTEYSNSNYILLSYIVEKVTKKNLFGKPEKENY